MKKLILEKNLWVFQFEAEHEDHLGFNIYALIHNKTVLLIDAAYEKHMDAVLNALKGYTVTTVIPSHYHEDHIMGINQLRNIQILGSSNAVETLQLYLPEYVDNFKPHQLIQEKDTLVFGTFKLRFYLAPGHSDCSMLIDINGRYLHVGDLYMTKNNGTNTLPFVLWPAIQKHIQSLEKIQRLNPQTLLLSHGLAHVDRADFETGINDRLKYLKAIYNSDNQMSAEMALKDTEKTFELLKWRDYIKN